MRNAQHLLWWLTPILLLFTLLEACRPEITSQKSLPILGYSQLNEAGDSVYHQIPDFALWDQDSSRITQELVAGKIYVSDFFFTSCPSICP